MDQPQHPRVLVRDLRRHLDARRLARRGLQLGRRRRRHRLGLLEELGPAGMDRAGIHLVTLADLLDQGRVHAEAGDALGDRALLGLGVGLGSGRGWLVFAVHGRGPTPQPVRPGLIGARAVYDNAPMAPAACAASAAPGSCMRLGPPLPRAFFDRSGPVVARDLVGALIVHRLADGTRAGRADRRSRGLSRRRQRPGLAFPSRARRRATARCSALPGICTSTGAMAMHTCANVVCEARGRGAAVLLRAIEPILGDRAHARAARPARAGAGAR